MRKFLGKSRKGFTLIELMIVVAIIGILAAIAIPNFIRFQLKAKTSEGKVNVAAIRTAEEAFFSEFGTYVAATAATRIVTGAPSPQPPDRSPGLFARRDFPVGAQSQEVTCRCLKERPRCLAHRLHKGRGIKLSG